MDLWAMTDLALPWAIRAAATLRLADLIDEGVCRIDTLAVRCESDPQALTRLLRFLIAHGLFLEPEPGVFALNDDARQLCDGVMRRWLDQCGAGGRMDHAWVTLVDAVRSGEPAYSALFGLPFWEDMAANPVIGASFDDLMAGRGRTSDIATAYDWSEIAHVVDVGGGKGHVLIQILEANPDVRGTVLDTPATAGAAREAIVAAGPRAAMCRSGRQLLRSAAKGRRIFPVGHPARLE